LTRLRFPRLPRHLGIIPDGNRRWAVARGLPKEAGYAFGLDAVNFLANYDWAWDVSCALERPPQGGTRRDLMESIGSADVPRLDLIVRWGGRCRLSGLLPLQSVYADFFVVDALWPDFEPEHLFRALEWYGKQDITLGG